MTSQAREWVVSVAQYFSDAPPGTLRSLSSISMVSVTVTSAFCLTCELGGTEEKKDPKHQRRTPNSNSPTTLLCSFSASVLSTTTVTSYR